MSWETGERGRVKNVLLSVIAIAEFKRARERQLILHNGLDNLLGSADYGLINQPWLAFIEICRISRDITFFSEKPFIYLVLFWENVMPGCHADRSAITIH